MRISSQQINLKCSLCESTRKRYCQVVVSARVFLTLFSKLCRETTIQRLRATRARLQKITSRCHCLQTMSPRPCLPHASPLTGETRINFELTNDCAPARLVSSRRGAARRGGCDPPAASDAPSRTLESDKWFLEEARRAKVNNLSASPPTLSSRTTNIYISCTTMARLAGSWAFVSLSNRLRQVENDCCSPSCPRQRFVRARPELRTPRVVSGWRSAVVEFTGLHNSKVHCIQNCSVR